MRQVFNLNWIRSFEASARALSFTEAARELNMTQAGVSQHVRLLEHNLNQVLFHRLPRGLQLTDVGEAYLHVVRESFDQLASGTAEIFGEGRQGVVTVRTNVAFATHWLATRVADFHAQYPDVRLRLLAAVHGSDTVWDGIDYEIRYGRSHASGFDVFPIMADRLFPVCHPKIGRELSKPKDLLGQRLIHVIGNNHGWTEWFQAAGLGPLVAPDYLQTDTSAIALELAAGGNGVALGHSSLVGPMLKSKQLMRPFAAEIETASVFHLVSPSQRQLRPEARKFKDWLLAVAGQQTGY